MTLFENAKSLQKRALSTALAICIGSSVAHAAQISVGAPANSTNNNFTMLDSGGAIVGGTNDVVANWDGTMFTSNGDYTGPGSVSNMSLSSTTTFSSNLWTAHDIQVFAPGQYTFDTLQGPPLNMTVGQGQVGVHMLFDWGSTADIDVAIVWNKDGVFGSGIGATTDGLTTCGLIPPATVMNCLWDGPTNNGGTVGSTVFSMVSIDPNGDGIPGIPMVDGPFLEFNANFNLLGIDINTPPVANNDAAGTTSGTLVKVNVVNNDTDAEDGSPPPVPPASITITSQPANGTASDNGDGTINYTPNGGFVGVDTFNYTLTDSSGATSINAATVTITVSATANTPPIAADASIATNEDTPLDINVDSVATDADGDTLTYATFDKDSTQGGTVTVDATDTLLTYTPGLNFNGQDTFTYSVTDGIDNSNVATITVNVNPVNDAPVCTDVALNTNTDAAILIDVDNVLLSTCTDAENDQLSLENTTQPLQPGSTLAFDGVNTLTYTPAPGFTGQDSFTYTVSDGTVSDTKTVLINVGKVFGNFTMIDAGGTTFGGTNDITTDWDGTLNTAVTDTNFNMKMGSDSNFPFFGFPWYAHDIRVFGPGNYSFDTTCTVQQIQSGVADCGGTAGQQLHLNVAQGQVGAHVLFDWNITQNIDVALLWDSDGVFTNANPSGALYQGQTGPTPASDCVYELVSRDVDGDGVPGAKMIDGPFINFQANFNLNLTRNCGASDNAVAQQSTVDSPNLGGGGCTMADYPVQPFKRSDLWLFLGCVTLLGVSIQIRKRTKKTG